MAEKRTTNATRKRVINQAQRRHEKWAEEMRAWGWTLIAPTEYTAPSTK